MRLLSFLVFAGWGWVVRLGGVGLIIAGVVDNSFIPIPGGMDILTIVLAAHRKDWWWYYAIMATIGSVIGAYLTFRLGRKGGEETLEKKVPEHEVERVYRIFRKFGFWAIFVPALCPPPAPIVPFVLAAGVLEYSRRKFLVALGSARFIRYSLVAYLGSRYGKGIYEWASQYFKPLLLALIGLAVVAAVVVIWYIKKRKKTRKPKDEPGKQEAPKVA